MLGHAYWQTKFGGDRNIVGQVFEMNNRPHTVVGVLPPVPLYPNEVDVYMPTSACPFRSGAERQHRSRIGARSPRCRCSGCSRLTRHPKRRRPKLRPWRSGSRQDYPAVYRAAHGLPGTDRQRARTDDVGRARDADDPAGHDGARAVDRVRQRREPHAGADAAPRSRAGDAHGAWRGPLAAGAAAPDREHAAVGRGRHCRSPVRVVDGRHADAVRCAVHVEDRRDRHRSRRAGVHAARVGGDGPRLRHAAGAGLARGSGQRA